MKYAIFLLGNPGPDYNLTRHNAARILFESDSHLNLSVGSVDVITPDTFMNDSGSFVKKYLKYNDKATAIIAYDDKDIELGKYKVGKFVSSGGHNGVQSIIDNLGDGDFIRIRIGITPNELMPMHGEGRVQTFVMGKFNELEVKIIKSLKPEIIKELESKLVK